VLESFDPGMLAVVRADPSVLCDGAPLGRGQTFVDQHEWVLDVAHNPQAARALALQLKTLGCKPATVVMGMLADKQAGEFVVELGVRPERWLLCPSEGMRSTTAAELAATLPPALASQTQIFASVVDALVAARAQTAPGGAILVCGSFSVVGPALQWLGLYSGTTG